VGRPRKHDRHLPPRMQFKHGAYYYTAGGRWIPLGRDYGVALKKWADLQGAEATIGRTVADAIAYYLQCKIANIAPRTLESYQISQKRLVAVFGHMSLDELRPEHVTRYLRGCEHKVQANRDKALLSASYNWVNAEGWLQLAGYNPARVPRNKEVPRDRYITDIELNALRAVARPKIRLMIELAYLTGLRKGDLLKLKTSDLTDEGIQFTASKTGKRSVIAWSEELRQVVDCALQLRRRPGAVWLFVTERNADQAMTSRGLTSEFEKTRSAAQLPDITWHDIRRKAGSDVEETHATELLGHTDAKVTKRHYRAKPVSVKPVR